MKPSSIIIAILIFGSLIFIHELGHYLFARLFRVKINEFSIGMGPKILSRKSKKTDIVYSWRLFPIGGYVSMDGEDDESAHPDAFSRKPIWQRLLITLAGPAMNIILGFIVMIVMVIGTKAVSTTIIAQFDENSLSNADGYLQEMDEIISINGKRVYSRTGVLYKVVFGNYDTNTITVTKDGQEIRAEQVVLIDVVVKRDGEKVLIQDVPFKAEETDGVITCIPDFNLYYQHLTVGGVLRQSVVDAVATIELIWQTLFDLIGGHYSLNAISGPVGVTEAINSVDTTDVLTLLYIYILISMNLGAFNVIPFPALDGWRILLLIIEAILRRPMNKKVEGIINATGLLLLFALMIAITCKDIIQLVIK